jgi:hypothetical protein
VKVLIDVDNLVKLVLYEPEYRTKYDIAFVETENITQLINFPNGESQHICLGSRTYFDIKDKRKFMLLVIGSGIEYKEVC